MINLSGNAISKVWREDGYIYKKQPKFLTDNEFWCLMVMYPYGYTPKVAQVDIEVLQLEDLGEGDSIPLSALQFHLPIVLSSLQSAGIRHGDLTEKNIIVKNNRPYIIDFAESRLTLDPRPDKRPEGDAWWLNNFLIQFKGKS